MSQRFYVVQVSEPRAGWCDLRDGAFLTQKPADDFSEQFTKATLRATRVIRKPHGWKPEGGLTAADLDGPNTTQPTISSQALEARAQKRR